MSRQPFSDGKRDRKPGEFQRRRRTLQRRQLRSDLLREGIRATRAGEEPWVEVDGMQIQLTASGTPARGPHGGGLYLVKTKNRGLRIALYWDTRNPGTYELYNPRGTWETFCCASFPHLCAIKAVRAKAGVMREFVRVEIIP